MSFLTERFYQILDTHPIYEKLGSLEAIRFFLERHVICVWGYHAHLRSIQEEIIRCAQPLNSEAYKEGLRLINELILFEEVDDLGDGRMGSHLEIYLEAMEELGCDMVPILGFFDLLESGVKLKTALKSSGFSPEANQYGQYIAQTLMLPIHLRSTILFYEGEPYIPDIFLSNLASLAPRRRFQKLLGYFERHIEGLKQPGFSAAGRLVEILCLGDHRLNLQAEKAAEETLCRRIEFWNQIANGLESSGYSCFLSRPPAGHLRLVT